MGIKLVNKSKVFKTVPGTKNSINLHLLLLPVLFANHWPFVISRRIRGHLTLFTWHCFQSQGRKNAAVLVANHLVLRIEIRSNQNLPDQF